MINLIEVIIRLDYWKRWPQCFAFRKSIQIYDSLSVPISKLWDHIWLWSRKKWSRSQGRDRGVSSRDENVKTRRMEDSSIVIDSLWWISPTQKSWQDWCLKCTRYKCSWKGFFWIVLQIWFCPLHEECSDCFQMKIGCELQSWRDRAGDFRNLPISHRVSSEALAGPNSNTLVS